MPEEDPKRTDPAWRAAQHRVRNDLQTLSALLRLSRRRASDTALLDAFPGWLGGLAAIYDVLPLWESAGSVPVRPLLAALAGRSHPALALTLPDASAVSVPDISVPAASALAVALGMIGLFSTVSGAAAPGASVRAGVRADGEAIRLEVLFTPAAPIEPQAAGWPPLSLTLAAEALDGRFAIGQDGEETVAVFAFPRR